jgi:hypothetical protein
MGTWLALVPAQYMTGQDDLRSTDGLHVDAAMRITGDFRVLAYSKADPDAALAMCSQRVARWQICSCRVCSCHAVAICLLS